MGNPFDTSDMAAGYAHSRPPVHPRVIDLLRPHLPAGPLDRALDVGCGAGLSTRALAGLAAAIYGIEPAGGMLRFAATVAPGARFTVAAAEALPFADRSFDLITAAGSLNWVDLDRFFPEASRILVTGGQLIVYDFSAGRSFTDSDALDRWFESFRACYPRPASEARYLDPDVVAEAAAGFRPDASATFEIPIELSRDFYLNYILTETNVAHAVRNGTPIGEIRQWCAESLAEIWPEDPREILFRGYFAMFYYSG